MSLSQGLSIEEAIRNLESEIGTSPDDFFEAIENNLREGQVRLVFFLEEAPFELKSIVDFLNKQMERSEVLIVEAKQYNKDGLRVVVPSLFGYTEQARRVKKVVTVTTGERKKWSEETFFQDLSERLNGQDISAVRELYDYFLSKNYRITWGAGKDTGSINVIEPRLWPKSICSIVSNGRLYISFGSMSGEPHIETFRAELANHLRMRLNLTLPEDVHNRWPSLVYEQWAPNVRIFIEILDELIDKYASKGQT